MTSKQAAMSSSVRAMRMGSMPWASGRLSTDAAARRSAVGRVHARAGDLNDRWRPQSLVDDAIAFRQPHQRGQLLLARIGVELEAEPDGLEADGSVACNPERPAE